jgi:hypothetical protein
MKIAKFNGEQTIFLKTRLRLVGNSSRDGISVYESRTCDYSETWKERDLWESEVSSLEAD